MSKTNTSHIPLIFLALQTAKFEATYKEDVELKGQDCSDWTPITHHKRQRGRSMSTATREFVVGQKLWYVPPKWLGRPGDIYVTKVGRKWISFAHKAGGDSRGQRFDRETLRVDDRGHPGSSCVYLSREEREVEIEGQKLIRAIMNIITEAKDKACEPST